MRLWTSYISTILTPILLLLLGIPFSTPNPTDSRILPMNPYWRDFYKAEFKVLTLIGNDIDELKYRKSFTCPIGSPTNPTTWKKSLTYYLHVLVLSARSFDEAIIRMKSEDKVIAFAELKAFGLPSIESAQGLKNALYSLLDKLITQRRSLQVLDEEVELIPGHFTPDMARPGNNINQLALLIEGGNIVEDSILQGQPEVEVDTTGRKSFAKIFEKGYREVSLFSEAAMRASVLLNGFMHGKEAFDKLVADLRPEEDGEGDDEDEDRVARSWTIPGIFERIADFANCWEVSLFDVWDSVVNLLGPLPEPGPPRWVVRGLDDDINQL
ncbi:hypothetical protein TWF694_011627 [Orbilia ellipsospora]|uniref:Uncharacterized protein n=1 Tax=Orbilia ellipsospora TaxID=2528407 RepID=A0AAV9X764_9PEZI